MKCILFNLTCKLYNFKSFQIKNQIKGNEYTINCINFDYYGSYINKSIFKCDLSNNDNNSNPLLRFGYQF